MPTVQKEAESVLAGREGLQEGQGPRPVPAVLQEPDGVPLADLKSSTKAYISRLLLWGAGLGPVAVLIVDRLAHLFGICLGH